MTELSPDFKQTSETAKTWNRPLTSQKPKLAYDPSSPTGKELDQNQVLAEYVREPGSQDLDRPLCMGIPPNGKPCRRVVRPGRTYCYLCREGK